MLCSDFHDRVNDLLDERLELTQDAALRQHANSCEACHRDLQNYQLLTTRGVQTSVTRPANDLRVPLFWLTAAATLFIAVASFPGNEQPTQTAQTTSPAVTPIVAVQDDDVSPKPIIDPLHPINVSAEDRVVVSGHFVQPILSIGYMAQADWSGVQPMEMPFGVAVPTVEAEWIDVVADEMLPIQKSVNSTFNLIVRTLSASA